MVDDDSLEEPGLLLQRGVCLEPRVFTEASLGSSVSNKGLLKGNTSKVI